MEYILILSFLLSGISAYFLLKIKLKYPLKLMVNAAFLLASAGLMALTGWKELSTFLYVILVTLTVGGVAAHFLAPLILNAVGRAVSEATGEKYKKMTYDELLHDGHRMYFAVLLFTTLELFLYTMLVCACAGLIK